MFELLVLVFDGTFEPVLAIQIHHNAALVETVMALGEIRFHDKGEELLVRLHLKDRRIVVAEMVIGALPEVGMRGGRDFDAIRPDQEVGGLSCQVRFSKVMFSVSFADYWLHYSRTLRYVATLQQGSAGLLIVFRFRV